jgi:3-(3-hydroxy-phenyl)propionate hydroxylase
LLHHSGESAGSLINAVADFELLHAARPVLLNVGEPGRLDLAPWADRVRLVDATCDGPWALPVVGVVDTPAAVLIRPDGYVAWTGTCEPDERGLAMALSTWFGAPGET